MYLPSKSLLYCWIHKAASTSWNKIFFDISHIRVREQDLHTAAQRFRPETDNIRELFKSSSLSFLFVRHPFERLVSAFVDKFETGSKSNWMYKMYAGDILNVTSDRGTPKDNAYLASMYRKLRPLDRPTFVDFVSYLLRTPVWEYNDHWAPYWLHCHLCGAHRSVCLLLGQPHTSLCSFDVIGKFETIRSDTEYIREEAGLRIETGEFPWQNKKGSVTSVTSVSQEYFKQIDMESRRKLYEIYRIDFEMFDYSSQQYFTREE